MDLSTSSTPSEHPEKAEDSIEPGEFKRLTVRTIAGILVLGILVGLAGAYLESHMVTASAWVTNRLGLAGLLLSITVTDAIISPLPPDLFLIVIAKGELSQSWAWVVPFAGLASAFGGFAGSFLGRGIGMRWLGMRARRMLEKQRPLLHRYGVWAIALGALTPIPFSVTCWLAGIVGIRPASVLAACLLRVPRFVLYYLFIVYADRLGEILMS